MPGDCSQDNLSTPHFESVDVTKIYPNPAKNKLHVECPKNSKIKILDLHGKLLIETISENGYTELSFENISPGAYFVTIENGKGQFIQKIIRH